MRELLDWFAELEVPASWIVEGEDEALARRLVAAGARPEATGWWSGRAIDGAFPSARPNGEVVVTRVTVGDELESWLELASRCGWIADERDRDARRYLYLSVGLADDSLTHWLALRDGRPVGMASSFQVNDVVDLCNLAVVVAERRRGIGRALAGARILAAQRGGARMAVSALSPDGWSCTGASASLRSSSPPTAASTCPCHRRSVGGPVPPWSARHPRPLLPTLIVVVVLGALASAALAVGRWPAGSRVGTSDAPTTTAGTTPTASPTTTTSTAPRPADACSPEQAPSLGAGLPPPGLVTALGQALADPGFGEVTVGASVWVDGLGEVLAAGADVALLPASTQKLFTAMGALSLFEPEDTMTTEVRAAGPVVDGVLHGDLVLVGGGDPTLTTDGSHSLVALVAQVGGAGIAEVAGNVVGDESRHDHERGAPGWQDWQTPAYVGPMSALMVDDNRYRADPGFLAHPATGNAAAFRSALLARGISVAGSAVEGTAPPGSSLVASVRSRPLPALVGDMLLHSDNEVAEMITKEAGLEAGGPGTTRAGTEALTAALNPLCLPMTGVADDGSGLSREDWRSAREWRVLLQRTRTAPWWSTLRDALPLAGRTGTLRNRFLGTPAEGNVRAKTGTIIGGRALAGYLTTAGGREAVFAVVVNGPGWRGSLSAVDRLVSTVAADRS